MKAILLTAACAVLAVSMAAQGGDVAFRLVDTAGNSYGMGYFGTLTLEVRALVTPTAGVGGLALFGFDFEAPPGVPLASNQFTTTLTSFVKNEGLTNPMGFGGTLSGATTLLQVGGGQNSIGYTGTSPAYPTGTVVAGVGLTEVTVATIVLDTWNLGPWQEYTFQISNGFANLIDPASQPSAPPYTVSAANVLAGSPTYTMMIIDEFEGPKLLQAVSRKYHGSLGELGITIPAGVQPNNRHIIEPRQGSVTKLVLTFDKVLDLATVIPANFTVCGLNSTPGNPATATLDGTGQIVTLTFADLQIPNGQLSNSPGDCYVLQISPAVTDTSGLPVDPTADKLYFVASFCNVMYTGILSNWKKVNAADRTLVVLNMSNMPLPLAAVAYDVWIQGIQGGRINATDVTQCVLSISATDLDNTVLPSCP